MRSSNAEARPLPVRVEVIDDSDVFLKAVRDVLKASPEFELVGEAASGEGGLAIARQTTPDMVIVDVMLPGIDGLETCSRLHAMQPPPLVVLCSVNDDPRHPGLGLPCAAAPFLSKAAFCTSALHEIWTNHRPHAVADGSATPPGTD